MYVSLIYENVNFHCYMKVFKFRSRHNLLLFADWLLLTVSQRTRRSLPYINKPAFNLVSPIYSHLFQIYFPLGTANISRAQLICVSSIIALYLLEIAKVIRIYVSLKANSYIFFKYFLSNISLYILHIRINSCK